MKEENADESHETVVQRIRRVRSSVRPAEQSVLQTILGDYPISGLVPVVQLAAKAGVSTATVLRVVKRLGYSGYALFQSALRNEVAARLFSPADVASTPETASWNDLFASAQQTFSSTLHSTFLHVDRQDFEKVIQSFSDPRRPVLVTGGYFSSVLASHLCSYLEIIRPSVKMTGSGVRERASDLLNVTDKTIIVVFDYRRYQKTIMDWAMAAKVKSAQVILFTDQYMSPLASHADLVIVCDARGLGRFDSLVSGLVMIDVIINKVFETIQTSAQQRLKDFETYRFDEEDDKTAG